MKIDLQLDIVGATKEMNKRLLVQTEVQKRAPVLKQVQHRSAQQGTGGCQFLPALIHSGELTPLLLSQAGGEEFSVNFRRAEVKKLAARDSEQKHVVVQLRFVFPGQIRVGLQFVKRVIGNQIEAIRFREVFVRHCQGNLALDRFETAGKQARFHVGFVSAFIAEAAQFIL